MAWTCEHCGNTFATNLQHAGGQTCTACHRWMAAEGEPSAQQGKARPRNGPTGLFSGFSGTINPASTTLMVFAWVFIVIGSAAALMTMASAGFAGGAGFRSPLLILVPAAAMVFLEWFFRGIVCAGLAIAIEAAVRARQDRPLSGESRTEEPL